MDLVNLLPLLILGMAVAGLAVALGLTIRANYLNGGRFRQQIAERVGRLRMGRMLARHGIDVREYLHRIPIVRLETEVRTCEGCNQTHTCDRALARETPGASFDFCANHEEFRAFDDEKNQLEIH